MKKLEDYKTMKGGFSTPEGYMDGLKGRLLAIPEREEVNKMSLPQEAPRSFWGVLKPQLNLAASFLLMIAVGYGLVYLLRPMHKPEQVMQAQEQVVPESAPEESVTAEVPLSNEGIIQYLSDTDIDYYYLANNK